MTEQENIPALENTEDESTPRFKHLRKLSEQKEALKKQKEAEKHLVKTEIEVVYDTRGRPKYRKVFTMPNGTKHRTYVPAHSAEAQRLKMKNEKKR